jgi:hypothetical protein
VGTTPPPSTSLPTLRGNTVWAVSLNAISQRLPFWVLQISEGQSAPCHNACDQQFEGLFSALLSPKSLTISRGAGGRNPGISPLIIGSEHRIEHFIKQLVDQIGDMCHIIGLRLWSYTIRWSECPNTLRRSCWSRTTAEGLKHSLSPSPQVSPIRPARH